jgi:hypothetical protein
MKLVLEPKRSRHLPLANASLCGNGFRFDSDISYQIDDASGVGTQIVAAPVSSKKYPDVVVGNKRGTFYLQHETKKVRKEEWEAAQPKRGGQ